MKYLAKNPLLIAFLRCFDFCYKKSKKKKQTEVRRIIVSNPAHLGDVIMATSILEPLQKAYPTASIDFICGSWSKPALEEHPKIRRIYLLDHWKISRRGEFFWKKMFRYFQMKRKLVKQLRKEKYDLAIDLYMFFPNCTHLFWKANIPMRVGFISGGSIFTHEVPWQKKDRYMGESYIDLLDALGIHRKTLRNDLPAGKTFTGLPDSYIVFHLHAGASSKNWEIDSWKELISLCEDSYIVFTGKGRREEIASLMQPHCINLCDKLSFPELVSVIQDCKQLVSVDTSTTHIATAVNTPMVVLYSSRVNPNEYRPSYVPWIGMPLTSTPQEIRKCISELSASF